METIKTICFLLALSSLTVPADGAFRKDGACDGGWRVKDRNKFEPACNRDYDNSMLQMLFRWNYKSNHLDSLLLRRVRQTDREQIIENVTEHENLPVKQVSAPQTDFISLIDNVKEIEPAKKLTDKLLLSGGASLGLKTAHKPETDAGDSRHASGQTERANFRAGMSVEASLQHTHQTGTYLNEGKTNSASQTDGLYPHKHRQRLSTSSTRHASVQVTLVVVAVVFSAVILVGVLRRCTRRRDDRGDAKHSHSYLQYEMQYRGKHKSLRVQGKSRRRKRKRGRELQNLVMFTIHEHDNEEGDSDQTSTETASNWNTTSTNQSGDAGDCSVIGSCTDLTTVASLNNPQAEQVARGFERNTCITQVEDYNCVSHVHCSSLETLERSASTTTAIQEIQRRPSSSSSSLSSYTSCSASDGYFGQTFCEQQGISQPTDRSIQSLETLSVSETIQDDTPQTGTNSPYCQEPEPNPMASTSDNAEDCSFVEADNTLSQHACASEINDTATRGVISALWQSWRSLPFNKDWAGARWFNRSQAGLKRNSLQTPTISDVSTKAVNPNEQSSRIGSGCVNSPLNVHCGRQPEEVTVSGNQESSEADSMPPTTAQNSSSNENSTQTHTNIHRQLASSISNDTNSTDQRYIRPLSCDLESDNVRQGTNDMNRSAQELSLPNCSTHSRQYASNVEAVQSGLDSPPDYTSIPSNVRSSPAQSRPRCLPAYAHNAQTDETLCSQRENYEFQSQQTRRSQSERRRAERERSRQHFRRGSEHNYHEGDVAVSNEHRELHHRHHGMSRRNIRSDVSEFPTPGFGGETGQPIRPTSAPSDNLSPVRATDGGIFVRHLSDGAQLIYIPAPHLPAYVEDNPPPYQEDEN